MPESDKKLVANAEKEAIGQLKVKLHNIEVKIAKLPEGSRSIPRLERNRSEIMAFLSRRGHTYNPAPMLRIDHGRTV